jgi:hypothetical protein
VICRNELYCKTMVGTAALRSTYSNPVFRPYLLVWHPTAVSDDFSKLHQRLEETLTRFSGDICQPTVRFC